MKHKLKITFLLLGMFLITQFIGLYVINHYFQQQDELPYGLEPPAIERESDYQIFFYGIVVAFVIAIFILFMLTKLKWEVIIRLWFFGVITVALGIFFNALIPRFIYSDILALALALPLSFMKIYKKNLLVHNLTELMVYPGIATIFVPILNLFWMIILLVLISVYDIWAVWHSGIMQKMAKYQIDKLNIFSGFFVPYMSKKLKAKIKKEKQKNPKTTKKVKVNIAILGGGDVIFPIITSGVILRTSSLNLPFGLPAFTGGLLPALFAVVGAALGLGYLLIFSEKKKFYPAMPFITAGIFLMLLLSYLVFSVF
jgi:presenilin-like A22 family membrane protease